MQGNPKLIETLNALLADELAPSTSTSYTRKCARTVALVSYMKALRSGQ